MHAFSEKKWFVYLGDHHEGPFSMAEIQEKMNSGQISRNAYVWCEGMPDWRPMDDVTAFISVSPAKPASNEQPSKVENTIMAAAEGTIMSKASAPRVAAPAPEPAQAAAPAPVARSLEEAHPPVSAAGDEKTGEMDPKARKKAEKEAEKEAKRQAKEAAKAAKAAAKADAIAREGGSPKSRGLMPLLVLALVAVGVALGYLGYLDPVLNSPGVKAATSTVGDAARPYLLKLGDKFPALARWFSPISTLEDVAPEDFEELKEAARTPEAGMPVKLGVALSMGDLLLPGFYAASALPDGATFDVVVEGIPETLLNHMSFSGRSQAVLMRRLGKSLPVKFPDGKPLPRGYYVVYVFEADSQPEDVKQLLAGAPPSATRLPPNLPQGRKLVSRKKYFLGGRDDANYKQRLKEYHDKLMQRAQAELNETKQFVATLDSQLGTSVATFTQLRAMRKGKVPKANVQKWNKFHEKWLSLDAQIGQTFQKWTPEIVQNEYFYGMIYTLLLQAGQAVAKVHGIHQAYFTGAVDPKAFDIQLGEAFSQAQAAIQAVRAKIEQAEKIPPTNGMPRKEGL